MNKWKSPKLYAKSSTGKIKEWQIGAEKGIMTISSGYKDGKIKQVTKKVKGVNIGKANETSDAKQAVLESKSKFNKKIDEQYVEDLDSLKDYADNDIILPMLAHVYAKRKKDIKFPCYVQPKLNGVRCIFQAGEFISRQGKEYITLEHLRPELETLGLNMPDGEIYVHGMDFQDIIRLVKKVREDGSNSKLEYWIYDQVNEDIFENRTRDITKHFGENQPITKLIDVPTEVVNSEEELMKVHARHISEGYEGSIVRNKDGLYKVKHRSADLQKLKAFQDDEFEIVGGKAGEGTEEGCVVFICKTKEGKEFSVRPKGSFELRKKWMKDIDKIKGKMLTVRFLEYSQERVPTGNTVGICIRDYE